jgi:L-alanine-DL-glutamate epimerase-like enolase superfamily enzyme
VGADPDPGPIAEVRVRTLAAPLEQPVAMACGTLTSRMTVLVEVETAAGLVGMGESWVNHPHWAPAERQATLTDGLAPLLLGEDPRSIAQLHAKVAHALSGPVRQWGGAAPLMQALSGVDIALWDLLGRSLGVGVAALIGGRGREAVPAYASGLGPEEVAATASGCVQDGWRALKVRVGFGPDVDDANLSAARAALGPEGRLFADANQGWTPSEARRMSTVLGDVGVEWIEEPITGGGPAELRALADRTGLTVALGENLYGADAFLPFLSAGGSFLLQPDVTKTGGFSHASAVTQLAGSAGVPVAPHYYGGAIGWAATLQLAAASPAVTAVEFDIRPNPLRDSVLRDPPAVTGGVVTVPSGPGLGVTLDDDRVDTYTVECRRRKL